VILSEKDSEVFDDNKIFAETLTEVIVSGATPLKIGIFASRGSGKSLLFTKIRGKIKPNH